MSSNAQDYDVNRDSAAAAAADTEMRNSWGGEVSVPSDMFCPMEHAVTTVRNVLPNGDKHKNFNVIIVLYHMLYEASHSTHYYEEASHSTHYYEEAEQFFCLDTSAVEDAGPTFMEIHRLLTKMIDLMVNSETLIHGETMLELYKARDMLTTLCRAPSLDSFHVNELDGVKRVLSDVYATMRE